MARMAAGGRSPTPRGRYPPTAVLCDVKEHGACLVKSAISLRAGYAMPGTDVSVWEKKMRACYAMPSMDIA
eukprot:3941344-Rhodomonas_salina.1